MEKQESQSGVTSSQARRAGGRRRWFALLLAPIAAGALSVSVARAHGFGEGHGHGPMGDFMHGRVEHVLGEVGASDAQKTQIKAIWEQMRPQLQPLHKQHADLRRQMGEAMAAATINTAQVEQLRVQSVQTMDKISALMTRGLVASAQVLTPEQRKVALQKMEERRGRHGDRDR